MSEHRTLFLSEEEEPTVVDLRFEQTAHIEAETGSPAARKKERRNRLSFGLGAALVLMLSMGLVGVAWEEHRAGNALREILEELRRNQGAVADAVPPRSVDEAPRQYSGALHVEGTPDEPVVGPRRELETRAASALSANDYREAMGLYRVLARLAPQESVFSHLVTILEARLRCSVRDELSDLPCP